MPWSERSLPQNSFEQRKLSTCIIRVLVLSNGDFKGGTVILWLGFLSSFLYFPFIYNLKISDNQNRLGAETQEKCGRISVPREPQVRGIENKYLTKFNSSISTTLISKTIDRLQIIKLDETGFKI